MRACYTDTDTTTPTSDDNDHTTTPTSNNYHDLHNPYDVDYNDVIYTVSTSSCNYVNVDILHCFDVHNE